MSWFSGLTITECKKGLEMVKKDFESAQVGDKTYWFAEMKVKKPKPYTCYLLPNYDEYGIGYRDRSAIIDPKYEKRMALRDSATYQNGIIIDGVMIGTWRRILKKDQVIIESKQFRPFSTNEKAAFKKAAANYGKFLGLKVKLI
jgi:hypothetical protein